MEGIPESGVYLVILGFIRCPTEDENGQEIQSSMERDGGPHHRWVYLSYYRRCKMGEDSTYNIKNGCKWFHRKNPWATNSRKVIRYY